MNSTQRAEVKKQMPARPRPVEQRKQWETFTDWAREQARVIVDPIAGAIGRLGVHPNTLTILGLFLQIGVGVVFGIGHVRLGGWLLLAVAPVDAFDGALARLSGKQSRFGAFLDSTLDRIADAALLLGLTAHYIRQGAHLMVALLLVSLVAGMMISYVRARAEALNFSCKVGLLSRMERVLIISILSARWYTGSCVKSLGVVG